jgi:hypothetical protein
MMRQTIIVASRRIEYDLKNKIYKHYQELSLSTYKNTTVGDLLNRLSEDVVAIRMYLGPGIMYVINLIILLVITCVYMLMTNVEMTIWTLIPLPILSFIIYKVSSIINRKSKVMQKSQSAISTFVQDSFSGIRVVKFFNKEKYIEKNYGIKVSHEKFLNKLKTDKTFKKEFYNKVSNTLKLLWNDEIYVQLHKANNPFFNGTAFLGKTHKEETKRKIGDKTKLTQKGELNSQYGTCWIIKEEISKKIKKEELESYLKEGWIKGRKCTGIEKIKEYYRLNPKKSPLKNKVSINKDGIIKFIDKNLLQEYIIKGWKIGRK